MKKIRTIIIALLLFALVIPFSVNSEETTSENSKINVYLFKPLIIPNMRSTKNQIIFSKREFIFLDTIVENFYIV